MPTHDLRPWSVGPAPGTDSLALSRAAAQRHAQLDAVAASARPRPARVRVRRLPALPKGVLHR